MRWSFSFQFPSKLWKLQDLCNSCNPCNPCHGREFIIVHPIDPPTPQGVERGGSPALRLLYVELPQPLGLQLRPAPRIIRELPPSPWT